MKIINNKIYITRGETPTYDVSVIEEDGTPFMISSGIHNPMIEFIVRPSVYDRARKFIFRALLDCTNIHKFDSDKVEDYNLAMSTEMDDKGRPIPAKNPLWVDGDTFESGKLYRREYYGEVDYRYYDKEAEEGKDGTHWFPYEFRISFMFPYESTSIMEAKTYSYGVALYGGNKRIDNYDDVMFNMEELPIIIDYMIPLIKSEDFIVEGTPNV